MSCVLKRMKCEHISYKIRLKDEIELMSTNISRLFAHYHAYIANGLRMVCE